MNKMKTLSSLALTLMLAGVLAACGSDAVNSPAPEMQNGAEESDTTLPEEKTKTQEDNSNHPTNENEIDLDEDAPAAGSDNDGAAAGSSDSDKVVEAEDPSLTIDQGSETADTTNNGTVATPAKEGSAMTKPVESAESAQTQPAAAEQTAKGSYVGLADSHTAEIEVDGKAVAYQLSEEAQQQLGKIPADAPVTFTYTEKDFDSETKVLTITDIKAE